MLYNPRSFIIIYFKITFKLLDSDYVMFKVFKEGFIVSLLFSK